MIAVNREKALHLAKYFQVRVCTCVSTGWKALGREIIDVNPPEHEAAYELRRLDRFPHKTDITKFVMLGLKDELMDFQPDIVLVENEPWSFLRWQVRWQTWKFTPRTQFVEFTWENIKRVGRKGKVLDWIYKAAAYSGEKIICGNRQALELCLEAGYNKHSSTIQAQLGIDFEKHPPSTETERIAWRNALGWSDSSIVIGFCGRLVPEKGLFELLEAVKLLRNERKNLCLALLGEGILYNELLSNDPNGEWLKILPAVKHEDVPLFLNKLDIFVLPSKPKIHSSGGVWEEQFGHVLIEAMACRVLTIGSNSGAIPRVLDDPEVTFKHSDTNSLLKNLTYWLRDQEIRSNKAINQRDICNKKWSHEEIARKYSLFLNS